MVRERSLQVVSPRMMAGSSSSTLVHAVQTRLAEAPLKVHMT